MKDFKDCLTEKVSTYLNEQKVSDVSKAAVLVKEYVCVVSQNLRLRVRKSIDPADFAPFVMDGCVSMPGCSDKVPVKMLRDTAASQSFTLEGVLPFSKKAAVGSDVPVLGFSMKGIGEPLHIVRV